MLGEFWVWCLGFCWVGWLGVLGGVGCFVVGLGVFLVTQKSLSNPCHM